MGTNVSQILTIYFYLKKQIIYRVRKSNILSHSQSVSDCYFSINNYKTDTIQNSDFTQHFYFTIITDIKKSETLTIKVEPDSV